MHSLNNVLGEITPLQMRVAICSIIGGLHVYNTVQMQPILMYLLTVTSLTVNNSSYIVIHP